MFFPPKNKTQALIGISVSVDLNWRTHSLSHKSKYHFLFQPPPPLYIRPFSNTFALFFMIGLNIKKVDFNFCKFVILIWIFLFYEDIYGPSTCTTIHFSDATFSLYSPKFSENSIIFKAKWRRRSGRMRSIRRRSSRNSIIQKCVFSHNFHKKPQNWLFFHRAKPI